MLKFNYREAAQTYFTQIDFKNSWNLEKLYFLPKINKELSRVPGSHVVPKSETLAEQVSEFLDIQLLAIIRKPLYDIKDSVNFFNKIWEISSTDDNFYLLTAYITVLYFWISLLKEVFDAN